MFKINTTHSCTVVYTAGYTPTIHITNMVCLDLCTLLPCLLHPVQNQPASQLCQESQESCLGL